MLGHKTSTPVSFHSIRSCKSSWHVLDHPRRELVNGVSVAVYVALTAVCVIHKSGSLMRCIKSAAFKPTGACRVQQPIASHFFCFSKSSDEGGQPLQNNGSWMQRYGQPDCRLALSPAPAMPPSLLEPDDSSMLSVCMSAAELLTPASRLPCSADSIYPGMQVALDVCNGDPVALSGFGGSVKLGRALCWRWWCTALCCLPC